MRKSSPGLTSPIKNLEAVSRTLEERDKRSGSETAADSSGRIDRFLFLPLTDLLVNDRYKPKTLLRWVLKNRLPFHSKIWDENDAAGFLMECYVKWSLSRYSEERPFLFTLNSSSEGTLSNGHRYFTGPGWNVTVINPAERRGRRRITEIDAIGEYHDGTEILPIIFEIKSSKCLDDSKLRLLTVLRKRIEVVQEMYDAEPYVCVVRPVWEGESPGFRKESHPGIKDLRYMLMPPAPHFREIARMLEEGFPKEGFDRKTAKKLRAVLAMVEGPTTVDRFLEETGVTGQETTEMLFRLWERRYLEFWRREGTLEFALGERGRVLVDQIEPPDSHGEQSTNRDQL